VAVEHTTPEGGDTAVFTPADSEWMQQALTLARQAEEEGEVPVGAVLVRDGELAGEGWNRSIGLHDPSAHAEIMALRDAGQGLKNYRRPGCVMYVSLEPCAMCVTAAIHARIDRLIFAASDPKTGALGGAYSLPASYRQNHELVYSGGLLAEEASGLLRTFFRQRRTILRD